MNLSLLSPVEIGYASVFAWNCLLGWTLVVIAIIILIKDWNIVYVIKRKRIHLALIVLILGFMEIVYMPLVLLYFGGYFDNKTCEIIGYNVYGWLGLPSLILFCWLLLTKFWLFYFDCKLISFETNKTWRLAIDPINESKNWYVIKSKTFGNLKYVLKWIIAFTIMQTILFRVNIEIF